MPLVWRNVCGLIAGRPRLGIELAAWRKYFSRMYRAPCRPNRMPRRSGATARGHRHCDRWWRGTYERVEPIVAAKGTAADVVLCHVSGRTVADPSGSQKVSDREVLGRARQCHIK